MEIDVDVLEKDINTSVDSEVLNASATEENIVNASVEKENVIDCSVKKNIIQTESDNTTIIKTGEDIDLSDYVTNKELAEKGFITEEQLETKNYITETELTEKNYVTNQMLNDKNFVQQSQLQEAVEESLPTFNRDFNIKNEDGVVKTFTNTGTTIDDKYIFAQKLPSSQPYSEVIFTENEYVIVYAKNTNQVFVSRNGIDFEEKPLNYTIKNMIRLVYSNRLVAFCNDGWFAYSDDDGVTWQYKQNTAFTTFTKIYNYLEYTDTFMIVNESTRRIESVNNNFTRNDYLTTTIVPTFVTMLNKSQLIWCTTGGVCKYKAGSQESNMSALPSGTVNLLKRVNGVVYGGYKNDNKIVYLDGTTTTSSWVTCTLPDTCTTNDIIYNPKDQTYYILTNINTYYKTKDFVTFESFDKDDIRLKQADMTVVGLVGVTGYLSDSVYVAPTQQKIENTLQELKRAVNKERWVGTGLQLDGEVISVKGSNPIMVYANGVSLMWGSVDIGYLLPEQAEKVMTGGYYRHNVIADTLADEIWNLWDGSDGVPVNVMFLESGVFYDPMSWETEYSVEKGDYGYLISRNFGMEMPFIKTGSLAPFLN